MKHAIRALSLAAIAMLLGACFSVPAGNDTPRLSGYVSEASTPSTHENFAPTEDKFSFAVFSDLTGSEREHVFDIAVAQLNILRPEFIVNVGDLIEGGTDRNEISRQWDTFDARARKARAPVFYTGGNHDLLGAVMREVWEERLGRRYYHFVYKDALFLILDTESHAPERLREIAQLRRDAIKVVNEKGWEAFHNTEYARMPEDETGIISTAQADYMIEALARNPGARWTFLLMHKAPWTNDAMPTWSAIEDALGDRPYTVFHGHRHAFRYLERKGRDYIRLPTTGGVFAPQNGPAWDNLVWVTVDGEGAHIANLKMSGILDKTGKIPLDGNAVCLESPCPVETPAGDAEKL